VTKNLPPQDQELWDAFTKNVRRLKRTLVAKKVPNAIKIPKKIHLPEPEVKSTQKVGGLHANDLRNIKIDGQFDLHGFRQSSGEAALRQFLKNAFYKDWRWVIVITGKGSPNHPSVLREQTPLWLQSMPELVTGYAFASPDDGGTGAFYVKIRRKSKLS